MKIIRIFTGLVAPSEQVEFLHRIHPKHSRLAGLLHTNDAEVSISFKNQYELEIERLDSLITDTMELPPAKRIITWDANLLDCSLVSGIICNLGNYAKRLNLYLSVYEK